VEALESLYREYGQKVEFRLIYVRPTGEDGEPDAPPVSELAEANREVKTEKDRAQLVGDCVRELKITFPYSMDDKLHTVHKKYNAWPSRACIVDRSGVVVYASKPGVSSVDPKAIRQALKRLLAKGKN
jgi:hypothetical protein